MKGKPIHLGRTWCIMAGYDCEVQKRATIQLRSNLPVKWQATAVKRETFNNGGETQPTRINSSTCCSRCEVEPTLSIQTHTGRAAACPSDYPSISIRDKPPVEDYIMQRNQNRQTKQINQPTNEQTMQYAYLRTSSLGVFRL